MYTFPIIRNIDDILSAIADKKEFIVAKRDFGTVVNYVVAMADTFDMTGPDDIDGAIRREARGIIFDNQGKIISRPFHKFFNVGEREETQPSMIDLSKPHVVLDKVDGSMVRPLVVDGVLRLATKMGLTDVAMGAEQLLNVEQIEWLKDQFNASITPLLEYVSPANKIVIPYTESKLILTAIRDNVTGQYLDMSSSPFEAVNSSSSIHDLDAFLKFKRTEEGREGDVIRFDNGEMLKVKNDWYLRIHKTKDLIRFDRYIAEIIINEQLDDIIPLLDFNDRATVRAYEKTFDESVKRVTARLDDLIKVAKDVYGGNKKNIALNMVPHLVNKEDAAFIFGAMDGKDVRSMLIAKIKSDVNNTAKYDKLVEWMQ